MSVDKPRQQCVSLEVSDGRVRTLQLESVGLGSDECDQAVAHGDRLRISRLRAGHRQNRAAEKDDLRRLHRCLGDRLLLATGCPKTEQRGEGDDKRGVASVHHTSP